MLPNTMPDLCGVRNRGHQGKSGRGSEYFRTRSFRDQGPDIVHDGSIERGSGIHQDQTLQPGFALRRRGQTLRTEHRAATRKLEAVIR